MTQRSYSRSSAEGSTQHEDKADLAFDPTADFHRYRIDYYPDRVTFYIDDERMQTWEDGFPDEPMHLMVNTWFPNWLDGTAPDKDQMLRIEWIRY
ncbi:MAG: glycoside hydrolase family 16 protein [Alkalibacterium sp.]|nr:glycoside hydrolase family 16 protein [Alkalibacterium sp.]